MKPDGTEHDENTDFFVFREPDGCTFTSYYSRVRIKFPYAVEDRITIDVPEDAGPDLQRKLTADWIRESGMDISQPELVP